jgi:hypothetical protein
MNDDYVHNRVTHFRNQGSVIERVKKKMRTTSALVLESLFPKWNSNTQKKLLKGEKDYCRMRCHVYCGWILLLYNQMSLFQFLFFLAPLLPLSLSLAFTSLK